MFWTEITRARHQRDGLRYASDTKDAQWAVIAPLMPPARRLGADRACSATESGTRRARNLNIDTT